MVQWCGELGRGLSGGPYGYTLSPERVAELSTDPVANVIAKTPEEQYADFVKLVKQESPTGRLRPWGYHLANRLDAKPDKFQDCITEVLLGLGMRGEHEFGHKLLDGIETLTTASFDRSRFASEVVDRSLPSLPQMLPFLRQPEAQNTYLSEIYGELRSRVSGSRHGKNPRGYDLKPWTLAMTDEVLTTIFLTGTAVDKVFAFKCAEDICRVTPAGRGVSRSAHLRAEMPLLAQVVDKWAATGVDERARGILQVYEFEPATLTYIEMHALDTLDCVLNFADYFAETAASTAVYTNMMLQISSNRMGQIRLAKDQTFASTPLWRKLASRPSKNFVEPEFRAVDKDLMAALWRRAAFRATDIAPAREAELHWVANAAADSGVFAVIQRETYAQLLGELTKVASQGLVLDSTFSTSLLSRLDVLVDDRSSVDISAVQLANLVGVTRNTLELRTASKLQWPANAALGISDRDPLHVLNLVQRKFGFVEELLGREPLLETVSEAMKHVDDVTRAHHLDPRLVSLHGYREGLVPDLVRAASKLSANKASKVILDNVRPIR